eukprot:13552065-Ditylum_brightwellii.AAC.1
MMKNSKDDGAPPDDPTSTKHQVQQDGRQTRMTQSQDDTKKDKQQDSGREKCTRILQRGRKRV